MTADNHIHTRFSPDGKGDPEDFVLRALSAGLRHIVFTEHVDLLYYRPEVCHGDIDGYFARGRELQKKYADRIYIGIGLEVGYTPENKEANAAFLEKYRPDYVINSVHQVGAGDCYYPAFFAGKTPREAAETYLRAVRESLDAPYPYHAVGHIGYVCRNAPYPVPLADAAPDLLDDILQTIVRKQKILELNTSVRGLPQSTLPAPAILARYVAFGGGKVCFSSDAHNAADIGRNYDAARETAAACGIRTQTVVEHGKELTIAF